jgi:hypothetical protein
MTGRSLQFRSRCSTFLRCISRVGYLRKMIRHGEVVLTSHPLLLLPEEPFDSLFADLSAFPLFSSCFSPSPSSSADPAHPELPEGPWAYPTAG